MGAMSIRCHSIQSALEGKGGLDKGECTHPWKYGTLVVITLSIKAYIFQNQVLSI